jgi:hypothetical protein
MYNIGRPNELSPLQLILALKGYYNMQRMGVYA